MIHSVPFSLINLTAEFLLTGPPKGTEPPRVQDPVTDCVQQHRLYTLAALHVARADLGPLLK
jgi:hypothetical protein